jgi:hypothetical protein
VDAVVHLAGESIMGRWTESKKRRIRESRAVGTRKLAESLAALPKPPRVFAVASAIGFYGDRGDETLTEDSASGSNFLADVCREWESAADPLRSRGARIAHMRFGVVLGKGGGALAQMLLPFRLGLGGPTGSGRQWMSWITRADVASAVAHVLRTDSLAGPVNFTAPAPARNADFAKALGRALRRPAVFPLPSFAVRLAFGQMGDELLLASARVDPARLLASGFRFDSPALPPALERVLSDK